MRSIIALVIAFPIYYEMIVSNNIFGVVCCILLQLLAGLDFKLGDKF